MKFITLVFAFILSISLFAQKTVPTDLTQFVNPFIGTAGTGHTFPGACLPFGLVQLSPDNEKRGWDFCSGYHSSDSIIIGFSHTHLSGTGCGDLQDVLVMPTTKALVSDTTNQGFNFIYNYKSRFSHASEQASPGYYSVLLDDSKIKAELTSTLRAGMHRYTFPKDAEPKIVIDLSSKGGWNKNLGSSLSVLNDSTVVGSLTTSGWAAKRTVYFTAIFSKRFKTYYTSTCGKLNSQIAESKGISAKFIACFDKNQNAPILLKVGISSVSIEGATKNLRAEMPSFDFDGVRSSANVIWQKELAKFKVKSNDNDRKKVFYTSLYHAFIHPSILSDVDGKYTGADRQIHSTTGTNRYHIFSLWDTFRALHPLVTLTDPKRANDFTKSLLAHYQEFGMLPNWELWGNDTYCMIGYHSFPVIVDAYLKGLVDKKDVESLYIAMKKNAMFNNKNLQHKGLEMYIQYGFMPYDVQKATCAKNGWSNMNESASRTLEWAFDDACLARMAEALGKTEDFHYFQKRSEAYKFLADTTTHCMRPRNSDGTWLTPFKPEFAQMESGFTEVNALQYSWFVPQNIPFLINFMGGKEKFVKRLDYLFESKVNKENIHGPDATGFIGQYIQGNEPSHHVPYLYNYAGASWKSQKYITIIRDSLYTSRRDGLCGNDDCGQMSAWYIFSALGFYPVNPVDGTYTIGTPLFPKIEMKLGNKTFTVIAKNISKTNIYIQSAKLNGKVLKSPFILHKDVMTGGVLEFEMGEKPNLKLWVN